ncbi:PREDICTED: zinc finger C3H1 domain-containing protein isoform X1 [Cyprinodon variegatus]|uniref:Zinc finger C3H1-type containing n=1 Tax=Cyprinodon variegatus TaxID=28743 RepID=A0A3Q2DDI4_CYPVA|nr:PREDICTED: zinc finger C3H1 domain-containing protein isoform X1 [Cyprinodon variegatus]
MNSNTTGRPAAEDGELEDGEICDDETEERAPPRRGEGRRPRGGPRPRPRKPHQSPHNMRPLLGPPPQDFRHMMPYNPVPHLHGPFPPNLRQPDRPPAPPPPGMPPLPLPPPPGLCMHGETNNRSNFWERSHGALGRFRHRVMPNGGRGSWNRGGGPGGNIRAGPGRPGPIELHGSPSRKQKPPPRVRVRKVGSSVNRASPSMDESFEDLLSKYKQIQLELDCIRKAETMALEPAASPVPETDAVPAAAPPVEARLTPEPAPELPLDPPGAEQLEKGENKTFLSFNIKPLRHKLPTPADLDEVRCKLEGQDAGGGADGAEPGSSAATELEGNVAATVEEKLSASCGEEADQEEKQNAQDVSFCRSESSASSEESTDKPVEKLEEEELSELQLRLLALQSASKKWQQQEQQVMKKSKDRIVKASQEKNSAPGSGATPPDRQRVTTRSAAAAAAEQNSSRSKPLEKDRAKSGPRPADRDRLKQSPKPGSRVPADRSRTPARAHGTKRLISPGSMAKQAARKQQLRTWKLQQQRKQEDNWRQEDEDRRKREEEIRRIRDLSNQDEQYNRFMKLVGGRRTRSRSRDQDLRKCAGKPGLDTSGNLYQYDNYDEVAMDTDSETSSPAPSPKHTLLPADESLPPHLGFYGAEAAAYGMDFSQAFLSPILSGLPPPPPPLPPPPDEPEPPPKPPFADEEEEEEMLLRETCLMSMANKRVAAAEDVFCPEQKSSSGPPSPSAPPPAEVQPPPRGNLSTVSLNTVPPSRSSRFSRALPAARGPLVLPRHKSVVVSLKDSDDSDSDMDTCSSSQAVFGGLEFMIKEVRRTVEATKPKAASGSEKENNPVRTPETLPEAKKAEYRLLKEEIASREKQRLQKDHGSSAASEPVLDSSKPSAELRLTEAEQKLNKHRDLLQRDEAVLRHLLQQELKKTETLRASETKVIKLREQLQASEKIVAANRTLLKKLQEQVQRVEKRVSLKKVVAVRLEQELMQAQLAAGRGPKRPAGLSQTVPSKVQRLDAPPRGSERHFAELIAQKRRLQQLESEYALKIQKLKEAQARHNKAVPAEPPAPASTPPPAAQSQQPPPASPFHLPQPSLHDLSQDKLVLDSEDIPEDPDPAPPSAAVKGGRRSSLRKSSTSFTKPHLETPTSASPKDAAGSKPTKMASSSEVPEQKFAGLDLDGLKKRYQQQDRLEELLQRELLRIQEDLNDPPAGQVIPVELDAGNQPAVSELKPVSFEPYHSPLLVFKSYRFSPYYRTKEKFSLSSVTYSNTIEPNKCFCRFDLSGTCNDDGCRWQHMRNCTMGGNQLFQDILSYNLTLIGCSESSSDEEIRTATENYMKKLFGPNKDRMGVDQKAVLLVSKVNESKRHVPPYTTCKDTRRWKPKPSAQIPANPEDDCDDEAAAAYLTPEEGADLSQSVMLAVDVVTSDDRRYFLSETDDISNLEASILESPRDTQLWIKLAFKYLNQSEASAAECLEAALNTLSRALESNCDDPEVWSHYLSLFSRRGSQEEVREMCEMAVEHAPNHRVWWKYLNLESSFEGKDYVCDRLLQFLQTEASEGVTEKLSFQLMEALLYRVQLSLFTGRMESALAILQAALKSTKDHSVAEFLTASHRALLWLSYIHLTEFDQLPSSLYDPAQSGPGRLVCTKSFQLPWRTQQDISTPPDILVALFKDAVSQCSEESVPDSERTLACMPLYSNLILLYKVLQRYDEGVALCVSLLEFCPDSCSLRDALADLHISRGNGEQAVSMWLNALADCPHNAQVFYHCCRFLVAQDKSNAIPPLFRGFILSLCEDEQSQKAPVDILRHFLGFSTQEHLSGAIIRKELEEQLRQQTSFLHLIHCRWMWLHGSEEEAIEAFEQALGAVLQLEDLHTLWMDYLLFSCRPQTLSASRKLFPDLVHRCLSTLPSRLEHPFNPAQFWSCYHFHNKVVSLYLRHVPQSQHALVLERLRNAMPGNTELGLRLLHQEFVEGNMEQLKFQARMLTTNTPRCLSSWRIAIAVERELKERGQVRLLYQQALQNLPLCAALWKDRLLFEAAESGASDRLQRLVDSCQQAGVILSVGGVDL